MGSILIATLAGYAGIWLLAYVGQRRMMYPAPREVSAPKLDGAELRRITTKGHVVHAFHLPALEGRPTLVHFHGNGETLSDGVWLAEVARDAGIGFFAVEYPGYGLSRDLPVGKEAILGDARAALEYLRDEGSVDRQHTVLSGQSLGSGVATALARQGYASRLILISPYTSTLEVAQRMAPILPMRFILRDNFDNLKGAAELELPVLILHGARDDLIPLSMGRRLSEALPNARLVVSEQANHGDLFVREPDRLLGEMMEFALAAVPKKSP